MMNYRARSKEKETKVKREKREKGASFFRDFFRVFSSGARKMKTRLFFPHNCLKKTEKNENGWLVLQVFILQSPPFLSLSLSLFHIAAL